MTEAQLRAFVAVAEHGAFGAAARTLSLTQPGVSRAVASLERELGAPLLSRGGGACRLTALGEEVLPRARHMLADAQALRDTASELRGVTRGRVRLGSMPSVSATILPRLLAHVRRLHPQIEIVVVEGHDDELETWARTGVVDVALAARRAPGLDGPRLATDELLAVLPAAHPLAAAGAPVPRGTLGEEPFVLTRAGCERLILDVLAEAGVRPRIAYEVLETGTILAMVGEGLGVSVMPELAARAAGAAVALRPLEPRAFRELFVVAPADRQVAPAARRVLDEVAALGGG